MVEKFKVGDLLVRSEGRLSHRSCEVVKVKSMVLKKYFVHSRLRGRIERQKVKLTVVDSKGVEVQCHTDLDQRAYRKANPLEVSQSGFDLFVFNENEIKQISKRQTIEINGVEKGLNSSCNNIR